VKVMVIIKASKGSEAGKMPPKESFAAMGKFNEQLIDAGIMVTGGGLTPSSRGARVRFSGADREVTDGPFAETKELIAGFWIWNVSSLQEAIDWVKKCPNPMMEDSDVEIRPFFEAEELAKMIDPTVPEGESRSKVRAKIVNWNP
jgi:hypothetical protein